MELSNLKIKKGINKLFYNDRNILLNCFSKNKIIVTSIKHEKDYMR